MKYIFKNTKYVNITVICLLYCTELSLLVCSFSFTTCTLNLSDRKNEHTMGADNARAVGAEKGSVKRGKRKGELGNRISGGRARTGKQAE